MEMSDEGWIRGRKRVEGIEMGIKIGMGSEMLKSNSSTARMPARNYLTMAIASAVMTMAVEMTEADGCC